MTSRHLYRLLWPVAALAIFLTPASQWGRIAPELAVAEILVVRNGFGLAFVGLAAVSLGVMLGLSLLYMMVLKQFIYFQF